MKFSDIFVDSGAQRGNLLRSWLGVSFMGVLDQIERKRPPARPPRNDKMTMKGAAPPGRSGHNKSSGRTKTDKRPADLSISHGHGVDGSGEVDDEQPGASLFW